MNIEVPAAVREPAAARASSLGLIDCDIHPKVRSLADIRPWLADRWWQHLQTYGQRPRHGFAKGYPFPKSQPAAARRDSWPPNGGPPASDIDFMRAQLLDHYGVEWGIMNPLSPTGQGDQNDELSAAMAFAINEWQVECMVRPEPRLRASVVVPYEDGAASAAEIRRRAGDSRFAQVLMMSRTAEPTGKRRYWPIFEAAAEAGLPLGIHVFGYSGWAMTSGGWSSYYIEEMTEHATSCQALVTSLIMEGVFERFPKLRVVLIESGFGWLPALGWRLDRNWKRMRDEVPMLKRAPSEYLKEHIWVTTQPMEEPERPEHLADALEWVGWDRLMFASDYPHWDFDDPRLTLPAWISPERRRAILSGNARTLYGLG
ncbi:amidohydrolase family protein [Roseomonas sp. BN140053]|uniref:amidohydrolase family protein n=1 Tax=Roseomonas sp. BN140053 TaxID=3391898 RepID=UPI0039E8FC35